MSSQFKHPSPPPPFKISLNDTETLYIHTNLHVCTIYIYKKAAIGYKSNEKREQYAFKCGGSIISELYILTGAYRANTKKKPYFIPFFKIVIAIELEDIERAVNEIISEYFRTIRI